MHTVPPQTEVRTGYNSLADVYGNAFDYRLRARLRIYDRALLDVAVGSDRVLEIGCGVGRLLRQVNSPVRIGVDSASEMVRVANKNGLLAVTADGMALPFPNASFDTVISGFGAFRYLDYTRGFAESSRVLVDGGRLSIHLIAARVWSIRDLVRQPKTQSVNLGAISELVSPAHKAGLTIERVLLWRPIRFWPYAVKVPSWLPGKLWRHCVVTLRKSTKH